ncbi:MAG: hypothetical protein MH204_01165 [Fimbriimonadaceae bacterium]|nr:hypothetical protein [Fimbriimonadaceae bacterium]
MGGAVDEAWREILVFLTGVTGSTFALARVLLSRQERLMNRFVDSLERALDRQTQAADDFKPALTRLAEAVEENSVLIRRLGGATEAWRPVRMACDEEADGCP